MVIVLTSLTTARGDGSAGSRLCDASVGVQDGAKSFLFVAAVLEGTVSWLSACWKSSQLISESDHISTSVDRDDLGLASRVYSSLPRELRNRVYTFCVQGPYDNEVIIRRAAAVKYSFAHLVREPVGPHSYQWVEDPVASYLENERIGLHVAREMLESYYWTRTFKFSHHNLDLLGTFLDTDRFGLGVTPTQYARRVQLQIQPFTCEARQQKWLRAAEALSTLRSARLEIEVQIDLAHGAIDDSGFENVTDNVVRFLLEAVQTVNELKEKGLRVKITFCTTWDEK